MLHMDMDCKIFMIICDGNQQPIHKEKFFLKAFIIDSEKDKTTYSSTKSGD